MGLVTWGTDEQAVRKTVYYEGTSTVYGGMPVCYNYNTTDNWTGWGEATLAAVATEQGTTAEGEHNEGKFIRVEDPSASNLGWFAGVVCNDSINIGDANGACTVEIFLANGAIVPVRCDIDTTTGVTVLSITSASQELGAIVADSRPVALAMETETALDGTAGITLAKLDPGMFSYNYGTSSSAYMVSTGTYPVNYQYVEFTSATQTCGFMQDNRLLYDGTMTSGQLTVDNNYLHFTGSLTAAAASYLRGSVDMVHLDGCTINSALAYVAGCCAQLGGTPAAFTACYKATALWVDLGVGTIPTAGTLSAIYISENGTNYAHTVFDINTPRTDYFAKFNVNACSGDHHFIYAMTADHTTSATDRALKCDVGGTTYYIPLYDGLGA